MEEKIADCLTTRQYMLSKDFEIYYYNEKYTSKIEMHTHNYYEFYFFIEGDVQIQIENEIYPLKCGDMVIIPPGRRHRAVVDADKLSLSPFCILGQQGIRRKPDGTVCGIRLPDAAGPGAG